MNKKIIGISTIIIIIGIIAIGAYYLTYISDYTYEDERISISVPAQTKFNIAAEKNNAVTSIHYNSSDKNNITIDIMKIDDSNSSLFGLKIDLFGTAKDLIVKDLTENKSYEVVSVTENYTIYYNKEKNRYATLIFDEERKTINLICCDNSSELINNLAESYILKSFNTNGLKLINIDNNNTSTNTTTKTTTPTSNNENTKKGIPGKDYPHPDGTWDDASYAYEYYGHSDVPDEYDENYYYESDPESEYY